jgi:predicted HAD superfamily phosphohydrolase
MPFLALDCEGPLTLNDNAFEYSQAIIPKGDYFFTQISRFDDYLADIKKKEGYKAGDTLKLILPFLKLFGANNKSLREFSKKTLAFLLEVPEVLPNLNKILPTFIISTSYKPYLEALCEVTKFPMENVFCTEVDLDKVKLLPSEAKILEKFHEEIVNMPLIELPKEAQKPEDLPSELLKTLDYLEKIFFDIIWNMDIGVFLREVNPIGGFEKAKACERISKELSIPLSEGFYVGDSITDTQALSLIKENKGVSLSFNGNRYALRSAEFYALSKRGGIFLELAKIFLEEGKEPLENLVKKEPYEFGKIPLQKEEFDKLVEKSEAFRKKVRGELIGALG